MTRPLLPYQADLLARLTVESADHVLITAPPGVGISTVLVLVAARAIDHGDTVLVVVPHRALLEQWAERLRAAGVDGVRDLRRTSDVVLSLDEPEGDETAQPQAIIATIQVLRHGAGRRAASRLSPSLLIVERPPHNLNVAPGNSEKSAFDATAAELASRSRRVIVSTNQPVEVPWLRSPLQLKVSLAQALAERPSHAALILATYAVPDAERELYEQARALVTEAAGPLPIPMSTRPALYGTLTRAAASLSGENLEEPEDTDLDPPEPKTVPRAGLMDELWSVIDRIEALEDDGRLHLVAQLINQALASNRPVLVVTDRVDEAEYVASRLRTDGLDVALLSASKDSAERRRATEQFGPGTAMVATRTISESIEQPPGTEQIWWSSPRTVADAAQRISRGATDGRIVAVVADPLLPDDRRLLAVLDRLQAETGINLFGDNKQGVWTPEDMTPEMRRSDPC